MPRAMRAAARGTARGRKKRRERAVSGVGRMASLLSWKIRGFGYFSLGNMVLLLLLAMYAS